MTPSRHEALHERMNDVLARKIDATQAKAERVARKAERHMEQLDRLAAHLEVLEVWTRHEPGARKPRFTREDIAAAAIRIADAEGFDAVSMRRIAGELDVGTMTLYHYVRTKDELLTLVTDTLMSELIIPPDEMPADWRAAAMALAHRSKDMIQRHPWLLDINDDPNLGPNSVRHFDQSLQVVAGLDVPLSDKLDLITMIDEFVFGYCMHQRTQFHDDSFDIASPALMRYVSDLAATGDYPHIAALMSEHGADAAWEQIASHASSTDRFDRNLGRLLDGFAASFGISDR